MNLPTRTDEQFAQTVRDLHAEAEADRRRPVNRVRSFLHGVTDQLDDNPAGFPALVLWSIATAPVWLVLALVDGDR